MSLINLLPEDYLRRKASQRANVLCMALFGVVMAGVLSAAWISYHIRENTQSVLDRVNSDYQEATVLMAELAQLQQQKQTMMEKAKGTSSLLERVPRSYLLAIVTNSLPPNASLVDVSLYPKRIISGADSPLLKDARVASKLPKGAKEAMKNPPVTMEMEITGMADTDVAVARFIASLAKNPLASSVDLAFSQEKRIDIKDAKGKVTATPLMREFQVRVVLRNDLDVMQILNSSLAQAPVVEAVPGGKL